MDNSETAILWFFVFHLVVNLISTFAYEVQNKKDTGRCQFSWDTLNLLLFGTLIVVFFSIDLLSFAIRDKIKKWRENKERKGDGNSLILGFDEWFANHEDEINTELAETGADREMDFDSEKEFDDRYEKYLEKVTQKPKKHSHG